MSQVTRTSLHARESWGRIGRGSRASLYLRTALLTKDSVLDFLACPPEMLGHVLKYRGEGSDPKRVVTRDRDVVLSGLLRGEPQMAPRLASQPIAEGSERLGQILARDIPRKPHTAMSSSRTKWSRISFGLASSSSKWQRTASRTCS